MISFFIRKYLYVKYLFKSIISLLYLFFSRKLFRYKNVENKILHRLSNTIDRSKDLLIISGGTSINDLDLDIIKNYNVFLNSYNTLSEVEFELKSKIIKEMILYYQAPYHLPIDKDLYVENCKKIISKMSIEASSICNITMKNNYEVDENKFEFRAMTSWPLNILKFGNLTGVLFLLKLGVMLGFKKIKIIGFDANWFKKVLDEDKAGVNLLDSFIFNYEILYQTNHIKEIIKINEVNIEINPCSWYNYKI